MLAYLCLLVWLYFVFLFLGTKEKKIIPGKIQLLQKWSIIFAKMISDTAGSKAKPYFHLFSVYLCLFYFAI